MSALDELDALLENLPNYSLITAGMKQVALDAAQIPDSTGLWPAETGYTETNDIYFAALSLLGFLQAQPVVRQTSSEGTSVAVDAPRWSVLVAHFRSMSPIARSGGNDIIQVVTIPDRPYVVRTDMSGRGTSYGDVDTDLS